MTKVKDVMESMNKLGYSTSIVDMMVSKRVGFTKGIYTASLDIDTIAMTDLEDIVRYVEASIDNLKRGSR